METYPKLNQSEGISHIMETYPTQAKPSDGL